MTATTVARLPKTSGILPAKGTMGIAANTLLLKGTLAVKDTNGYANVPAAGRNAVGVLASTYDNRTTSRYSSGAAAEINAEIDFGEFEFPYSGTAPKMGEVLFVIDNQTVGVDSSGGTRGTAGYCVNPPDTTAGTVRLYIGPHVSSAYADVSAVSSVATAASTKTNNLAVVEIPIGLGNFRKADGTAVAAFANGTVDGFALVDSEAFGIRWNDDVFTAFWADVRLPTDLDTGSAVELHFLVSKIGSTDTTAVLTVSAFRNRAGVTHDAGSDLGGNTTAISSATKTPVDKSVALATTAAGDNISFSVVPSAALDDDDLVLLACWLKCTRTGA